MIRLFAVALIAFCISGAPASAQGTPQPPTKIFVASTGSDSNNGGRATPMRSFQAAHNAVADGGNIVVLDTAGYGALTITKSVAITVPPGVSGFITTPNFGGLGIDINAGPTAVVTLQGLIIEGPGSSGVGVRILSAGTVTIEDTQIRRFVYGVESDSAAASFLLETRRTSIQDVVLGLFMHNGGAFRADIVDTTVRRASGAAYKIGTGFAFLTRSEATGGGTGLEVFSNAAAVIDACKFSHSNVAFVVSGGGTIYSLSNNAIAFNQTYITGATDLTALPAR